MNVTVAGRTHHYRTVTFDATANEVRLIDQRLLPHEFKLVATGDYRQTARAIAEMIVRGAPAIAATAAYGLAQGALAFQGRNLHGFQLHVERVRRMIAVARPTAVDPINAMREIHRAMGAGVTIAEQQALALAAAEEFAHRSVQECEAIGRHGAKLIRNGACVLTHCNAGWLGCVDIGTVTAPMYAAQAQGRAFQVLCDETRPRCQGASLTAWELAQQGISHKVIADNAAGWLMQRGEIDLVIVGSDRTLGHSGDVANKIGTYTVAVLARRHDIPFYVAIPLSSIDWSLKSGRDIPIEERDGDEVLGAWGQTRNGRREYVRVANPTSLAGNPSFDVTPAELVTGIITPRDIFKPHELRSHWAELASR